MNMKKDFEKKIQIKIEECQSCIEKLKEKSSASPAELRQQCCNFIDDLSLKQEAARKKLEEIRKASEEDWKNMYPVATKLYDALAETVEKALDWGASKFNL